MEVLARLVLAFNNGAVDKSCRGDKPAHLGGLKTTLRSNCFNPRELKVVSARVPHVRPTVSTADSTRSPYGMRVGRCRHPLLCSSERADKDSEPPAWEQLKEAFTTPPSGWPPADFVLLVGDLSVLLVGAFFFTAYFREVQLNLSDPFMWLNFARSPQVLINWCLLVFPWLVAGSVTNAWDETAGLPGYAMTRVVRTAIDYSTASVALELISAVSQHRPGDLGAAFAHVLTGVAFVALWRKWASTPEVYW